MLGPDAAALIRGRGLHLGDLPSVLAARYGDRVAVEEPTADHHGTPTRTSFQALEQRVATTAGALAAMGVTETERVLIVVDGLDVAVLTFAAARLGAVAVPVNHRLDPAQIKAIAEAADTTTAVVADDDTAALVSDHASVWTLAQVGARSAAAAPVGPAGRSSRTTAVMLATSGTTGTPKAAELTSRGLLAATGRLLALPVGRSRGLRGGRDRVLAALPLTHVMGLSVLAATLCAGVPLVRPARFDAPGFLQLIETRRPNVVVGVPTMYTDLEAAGADSYDLSSVQLWVSSADVLPLDRARRFQRRGASLRVAGRALGSAAFLDIYGMVELSGPAAVRLLPPTPVGPAPALPLAFALPGIAVRAVDGDGRPVRAGTSGELQWRGGAVLRGYAGHGDARDDEGWFASGDHGRVWPGGLLQFSGRSRDRCKVGGFSVFPAEVETALRGAPGVRELAVVGVPDDRLGERLVLAVVPAADYDEARLRAWTAARTSGYRRPREVVVLDGLARGNHGKIDRAQITTRVTQQMTGTT